MNERLFLRLDDDPVQGPEADAPSGTLRTVPVGEALRTHVSHVLLCREDFTVGHEVLERVLPDGAVRLIFNLGETSSPSAVVVGASTACRSRCVRARWPACWVFRPERCQGPPCPWTPCGTAKGRR